MREVGSILGDLERQGAQVEQRAKNVKRVTFEDGSTTVVHCSPSDINWSHSLRRATLKAGLAWPGEDRKHLKTAIKEKQGKMSTNETFTLEYGDYVKGSVSQETRDSIARLISGKSRYRVPDLEAATKFSRPTVVKSLIALGWLQVAEMENATMQRADGRTFGYRRAYWAPASESALAQVKFKEKGTASVPKVVVTSTTKLLDVPVFTPAAETDDAEIINDAQQDEWLAEAAKQEQRAVTAETEVERLKTALDAAQARQKPAENASWATDLTGFPEALSVHELRAIATSMGLEIEIRLRRV